MGALSAMTSTLAVQRQTTSKDASGATLYAWTTRLSGIPCRYNPTSASEQATLARADMIVTGKVFTVQDTGAQKRDRYVVTLPSGTVLYLFVQGYQYTATPSGSALGTAMVSERNPAGQA